MFQWFRRQRKRDPVVTAEEVRRRLLVARQQQMLSDERDGLVSEAFARDAALQIVNAADTFAACRDLVRDHPGTAAVLLSLASRGWLACSRTEGE